MPTKSAKKLAHPSIPESAKKAALSEGQPKPTRPSTAKLPPRSSKVSTVDEERDTGLGKKSQMHRQIVE